MGESDFRPKTSLNIDVLGSSIRISVEEEPEYLNKLLETFKQKLENTGKTTGLSDPLKTAILTGFILCDELEKALQDGHKASIQEKDHKAAEELALKLISRLDNVLEEKKDDPQEMIRIFKLKNSVKNYDWGSSDWIPRLLGENNEGQNPWAELWMGIHPEGPSMIMPQEGLSPREGAGPLPLSELIAEDPQFYLGEEAAKSFGTLPFLLKILAVEKPLSIQAHPNLNQAREGWERENKNGIALEAPNRNYKDANHKPEFLCALSPFLAMAGFRETSEIRAQLESFLENAPGSLQDEMTLLFYALEGTVNPLKEFLRELFSLPKEILEALGSYATQGSYAAQGSYAHKQEALKDEWKLIAELAMTYPGDPAIISPLYLNLIKLNPGEAIYLPSGVPHTYVYGLGVELMANSDNVLRGGLTSKYVDLEELFSILDFNPYKPTIIIETGMKEAGANYFQYPVLCREFSLSVIRGGEMSCPLTLPIVIIITRGELRIKGKGQEISLKRGESAFIPPGNEDLRLYGDFTLYAAGIGSSPEKQGEP